MCAAPNVPAPRATAAPAPGSKISSAPTGASTTGNRSLRPNSFDGRVDLGDIAQHARTECNLVERHAVAAHGGLGLGGPDDIVPGILIEIRPRLADELVKVLELFAAGAEFDTSRLDGRPVIHGVSLPFFGDNSRCRPDCESCLPARFEARMTRAAAARARRIEGEPRAFEAANRDAHLRNRLRRCDAFCGHGCLRPVFALIRQALLLAAVGRYVAMRPAGHRHDS